MHASCVQSNADMRAARARKAELEREEEAAWYIQQVGCCFLPSTALGGDWADDPPARPRLTAKKQSSLQRRDEVRRGRNSPVEVFVGRATEVCNAAEKTLCFLYFAAPTLPYR